MKKNVLKELMCMAMAAAVLSGCGNQSGTQETPASQTEAKTDAKTDAKTEADTQAESHEPVKIMIAAAASLENAYVDELIPMFEGKYDYITVEGTYDSSGKLQTQIESGLEADVFMSAATKQMNALKDEDMIEADSIVNLLENKLVLIVPKGTDTDITGFEDITKADMIAIGDPDSVPAGQYAREAFTSIGNWDEVSSKASLGTNVTEVLRWVEESSADAGIVYATDAASSDKVDVIAEAPKGSLKKPVIYPAGILSGTKNPEEAKLFMEFLQSDEALSVFEKYGFTINR